MSDKVYSIEEIKAIAAPIAKDHGVASMFLFGSYARGEATAESDPDFRIEKGRARSLFQPASLQTALEKGFDKSPDVLISPMLTRKFPESIQPEEVLLYPE